MSQLVVFVLDATRGEPAQGITVLLQHQAAANSWCTIAQGHTDDAGTIPGFIPDHRPLPCGDYRLVYRTREYYRRQQLSSLYTEVVISFSLEDKRPLVLPLLLSPHGYSTYRGS